MISPQQNGTSLRRVLLSVAGGLFLPVVWYFAKNGLGISDRYLPSISAVIGAVTDLDPGLGVHVAATVTRLAIGFVLGTCGGIAAGIMFARWPFSDYLLNPSIQALRAVPAAATVPFFLLWFGFSELGRYLLVLLAVGLNVAVASHQVLASHSRSHAAFFHSFGLNSGEFPLRYSLPRVAEAILPTLRYSLALSIGAVTVSELLGSQTGLGYLLQTGRSTFALHLMFLAMIAVGVVAAVLDWLLQILWRKIIYWNTYE